jgi:hypothetical protein
MIFYVFQIFPTIVGSVYTVLCINLLLLDSERNDGCIGFTIMCFFIIKWLEDFINIGEKNEKFNFHGLVVRYLFI